MTQGVLITTIICATVVVVCIIGVFANKKK